LNHWLRVLFFVLVVKPLVTVVLGTNVKRGALLPRAGPAVLVANHNSHLDTLVLMSLFPMRMVPLLRPVAAADYFLRHRFLAWFALRVMGIIPLNRAGRTRDRSHPLAPLLDALNRGEILILFPEGTRGEPEELSRFKSGVAHLMKARPDVPVSPLFMHGVGKALPRGEALLVPCICDISVGEPLGWRGDTAGTMLALEQSFNELADEMDAAHRGVDEEGDDDDDATM
jgi:1-acyl-sn-glycerol-3-phosphate acyltransferase